MSIQFTKLTPEITQSEARGFKEEHQIWLNKHYVGSIYVSRGDTRQVSVSFQSPQNQHLNKWWGELTLPEAKVYVTQLEEDIQLDPDLQEHYDNVTGFSRVG